MKLSGIYKIQSRVKPERVYIGSAINIHDRWRHHSSDLRLKKHSNNKLQHHCDKYGIADFQFSILLGCEKEDLLRIEQYFIDSYIPWFNINPIAKSRLGSKCSEEVKQMYRDQRKGMKLHLGHKHSDETKRIMSLKKIGHIPWNKGGAEYSQETRNAMSIAKKGKKHTEEHKLRISEGLKKFNKAV